MQTFSSANRTCSASASAVECTATERRPMSRQARTTRRAISPRLAMRTFLNTGSGFLDAEQRLTVPGVLTVAHHPLQHLAVDVGLDLVHQLHRLDDADDLPLVDGLAGLDEGARLRRGRTVEGPHEGGGDHGPPVLGLLLGHQGE